MAVTKREIRGVIEKLESAQHQLVAMRQSRALEIVERDIKPSLEALNYLEAVAD